MKKFIAVLLAVLTVFSVMSVCAFAADTTTDTETTEEETTSVFSILTQNMDDKVSLVEWFANGTGASYMDNIKSAAHYFFVAPILNLLQLVVIIALKLIDTGVIDIAGLIG